MMPTPSQNSIKLIPFQTQLLQALSQGVPQFEKVSRMRAAPDWPNPDFADAIPFFIQVQTERPELAKWNFLIVTVPHSLVIGGIGSKGPVSDHGEIEVGYGIAASHHRRGYATLAQAMKVN